MKSTKNNRKKGRAKVKGQIEKVKNVWSDRLSKKGIKLGRKRKFDNTDDYLENRQRVQRDYRRRQAAKKKGELNKKEIKVIGLFQCILIVIVIVMKKRKMRMV